MESVSYIDFTNNIRLTPNPWGVSRCYGVTFLEDIEDTKLHVPRELLGSRRHSGSMHFQRVLNRRKTSLSKSLQLSLESSQLHVSINFN